MALKDTIIKEFKEMDDVRFSSALNKLNTYANISRFKEGDDDDAAMTDEDIESMFRALIAEAESRKDLALPSGGYLDLPGLANLSRTVP